MGFSRASQETNIVVPSLVLYRAQSTSAIRITRGGDVRKECQESGKQRCGPWLALSRREQSARITAGRAQSRARWRSSWLAYVVASRLLQGKTVPIRGKPDPTRRAHIRDAAPRKHDHPTSLQDDFVFMILNSTDYAATCKFVRYTFLCRLPNSINVADAVDLTRL